MVKLFYWLDRFIFINKSSIASGSKRALPDHFYQDMAFDLAMAPNLNETLSTVLDPLQQQLDMLFTGSSQCQLYLMVNTSSSDGCFIQHAPKVVPPLGALQQFRRAFDGRQHEGNEEIYLSLPGQPAFQLQANLLVEHQGYTVWAILLFQDKMPLKDSLNWQTMEMMNALRKGISAWYRGQQNIDEAIQAERTIHAAELHDSLAQMLGYLRIKSARLNSQCKDERYKELRAITEDLELYTHSAYRQTRELITTSRLSMNGQNLTQAVSDSVTEFEQRSGIVFELDNRLQPNATTPKQALQILYIIREALSNIVRHSHASHSRITMSHEGKSLLQICIEDNGAGAEPNAEQIDSFGLRIMKERAARIDGKLNITPRQKGGTRVELILPIDQSQTGISSQYGGATIKHDE